VISDAQITLGLAPYGVAPDDRLCRQIRDYISLLVLWNQRISLTTVIEPEEMIRFHFGESLFALSKVPIQHGRLADVGSGAGFPGIPIGMFVPDLDVTLIEANLKKAVFLSEVIRELGLLNTRVLRSRMTDVQGDPFDFVTARAIGSREELVRSSRLLIRSGKLILWIGEDDAALVMRDAGWTWRDPVRIPASRRRALLIGTKSVSS
jgi:16S rRNA (guanine527-N7)-methyltransferase